jgi:hypothetical protein
LPVESGFISHISQRTRDMGHPDLLQVEKKGRVHCTCL